MENQNDLDPREWKTFDDWMKEHKYVVIKGEKGTYVNGKYYFHRHQVTLSKHHPLSPLWRKSLATADFSVGRMLAGGLGAAAIASPFLMGGDDDEDEGPVDMMDPAAQVQRARTLR